MARLAKTPLCGSMTFLGDHLSMGHERQALIGAIVPTLQHVFLSGNADLGMLGVAFSSAAA